MSVFSSIFVKIEEYFRALDPKTWGIVISVALFLAIIGFLFSTKGSAKGKFVKNQFLFIISILIMVIALVATILSKKFI